MHRQHSCPAPIHPGKSDGENNLKKARTLKRCAGFFYFRGFFVDEDKSEFVICVGLGVTVGLLMAAGIVWAWRAIFGITQTKAQTVV
jgi:hypothetical protein